MKYSSILLALVLSAFAIDPVLVYVPELKPIKFAWDHDRRFSSPGTYYNFYHGTNFVTKITTNQFTITTTNGVGQSSIEGQVIFAHELIGPNATNNFSVRAFDPISQQESDPNTNVVLVGVVGKPLPPSDNRKL